MYCYFDDTIKSLLQEIEISYNLTQIKTSLKSH
jgi:hypothetical protein